MRRGSFRANVLRLRDIDPTDGFPSSDPGLHDHLILAEGDSWFSIGGFPPTNMLYALRFHGLTMVVTCAEPGDTITNIAKIARNTHFKQALSAHDWNAILLSGGGNDLIDKAGKILLKPGRRSLPASAGPAHYCDTAKLDALMDKIQAGFRKIAARRDAASDAVKDTPIVTHTYDYTVPRNEPARFIGFPLQGPWLYKAVKKAKIPQEDWIAVARYLINRLADTLLALETGPDAIGNFYVVDTRGTLTPPAVDAIGPTTHWLNEIHPNFDGFSEIAEKIEKDRLYGLLYGA